MFTNESDIRMRKKLFNASAQLTDNSVFTFHSLSERKFPVRRFMQQSFRRNTSAVKARSAEVTLFVDSNLDVMISCIKCRLIPTGSCTYNFQFVHNNLKG